MKIVKMMVLLAILIFSSSLSAQEKLSNKESSLVRISSYTASGNLSSLKVALSDGLDAGLTINEIKEALVHVYAYCGFPRSIRGLQTFMTVLEERKATGIQDMPGKEASPIAEGKSKYERGKTVLGELTGTPQPESLSGYGAFAPVIDTFLKEHLFADIFERDVLDYAQRELVTISVLATIGEAEPMLRSHMNISLNVGIKPSQLEEFVVITNETAGQIRGEQAKVVLNELLKTLNKK